MIQLSFTQGQRLKREGQETVEVKNEKFLENMRAWAIGHSLRYGYVTSDDVRRHSSSISQYPTHHNAWGAVFRGHGWTCIGRKPSELETNHYREIRVWKWEGA